MHIHLGHHFYGAGNIGDDWMLAGFLQAMAAEGINARVTCCTPHDLAPMRLRFPGVEWSPYTPANRERLIAASSIWLGLGGTPFQRDASNWMLDHLVGEVQSVKKHHKRAFMLGVGVESLEAVTASQAAEVIKGMTHIWTRDEFSARSLLTPAGSKRLSSGADLAHVFFAKAPPPHLRGAASAIIFHVEKSEQLSLAALGRFLDHHAEPRLLWIAQEVRMLNFSEMNVWGNLPITSASRATLAVPDYRQGSLSAFLGLFDDVERCLTTRYHGALAAAWRGARVAVFPRSGKLLGLTEQLEMVVQPSLLAAEDFTHGLAAAAPVPRSRLAGLAALASRSCSELFSQIG